jgi:hypothetical protein
MDYTSFCCGLCLAAGLLGVFEPPVFLRLIGAVNLVLAGALALIGMGAL